MDERKLIPLELSEISKDVVEVLLLDSTTEPSIFDEIAHENTHRPEIISLLVNSSLTPENTRKFAAETLKIPIPVEPEIEEKDDDEYEHRGKTQSLLQRVQSLKMGEKMQLAFKGSREIRSILLRDPNQDIMMGVLNNPKITESEIELLAKQKSTSVDILRAISKKREWVRSYTIIHCLVSNPKTPIGIALKHIHTLRSKDLAMIEKDRNISGAVRANAKKIINSRK